MPVWRMFERPSMLKRCRTHTETYPQTLIIRSLIKFKRQLLDWDSCALSTMQTSQHLISMQILNDDEIKPLLFVLHMHLSLIFSIMQLQVAAASQHIEMCVGWKSIKMFPCYWAGVKWITVRRQRFTSTQRLFLEDTLAANGSGIHYANITGKMRGGVLSGNVASPASHSKARIEF